MPRFAEHLAAERPDEAAYILEDSGTSVVLVGSETLDRGLNAARQAGVRTVVAWGRDRLDGDVIAWDAWLAEGSTAHPLGDLTPQPNLLSTSGTLLSLPEGFGRATTSRRWSSSSTRARRVRSRSSGP
ncbi:MAG TPA: hypothetical protein VMW08_05075 [Acidimicrobiales bacterium]|nr:hypothetical protein [Acidimicrobiales bacterium]